MQPPQLSRAPGEGRESIIIAPLLGHRSLPWASDARGCMYSKNKATRALIGPYRRLMPRVMGGS